ncbi:hypothetical protein ACFLSG_02095 [Candidatus Bipolaricaulota bacterium]
MRGSSIRSVGLAFPWRATLSWIIALVALLSVALPLNAQVPTAVTGVANWHDLCFDPTLGGIVNGFGLETVVEFEWEDTANEPGDIHREFAQQSPIINSGEIEVSLDIVIVAPCIVRFRVIATNANGTTYGEWTENGVNQPICLIDNPDEDPSLLDAETLSADYHGYCKDPTLYGRVNGHGLPTTVQFEWEELNGIGSGIELADQNPITIPYPEEVEVSLSITTATNAVIRYRVIATSDVGTVSGEWVEAGPEISCKIDLVDDDESSNESQQQSCLQIASIACIEGQTQIMVANCGPEVCSGDAQVHLGLSYDQSWIPEWHTLFFSSDPRGMELEPGEYAVFTIDVPLVPRWALTALRERLTGCWTGYEDKDPENDYLGVIFLIGDEAAYGFLPLEWHCSKTEKQ